MNQELSEVKVATEPEVVTSKRKTRRAVLGAMTSATALLGLVEESEAQTTPFRSAELKLLDRITYGATQADLTLITQMGYGPYLEKQLTMTVSEDSVCEAQVKLRWPHIHKTAKQIYPIDNGWEVWEGFRDSVIYREVFSKRQLHEKMCEFWRDHFNIFGYKVGHYMLIPDYNNVVRKHALGKFPDMLWASAHSAAMMQYLDNASSYGGNPNQNYAREIMELHSMGVSGGYTQNDVIDVTSCFTGYTYEWDAGKPNGLEWMYADWMHADGVKHVLGRTIPAGGGIKDAELVMRILSTHLSTAKFLAKKLIKWFLGEGTPASLLTKVSDTYLRTGGDIKAMLRDILTAANMSAARPKLKRPGHLYVGALRAMNPTVSSFSWMRWGYMSVAGQDMFGWATPDGMPDKTTHWQGLLLPRWNFFFAGMSGGFNSQFRFDLKRAIGTRASAQAVADRIDAVFCLSKMPLAEKDRIIAFLRRRAITDDTVREAAAIALCMPSYQWF